MSESEPAISREAVGVYQLLGTNVEIRAGAQGERRSEALEQAEAAEAAALAEMLRLQAVFSVFDPDSQISRWRSGATEALSPELVDCLAQAQHWWRVSGGAFHPSTGRLRARWLRAEAEDRLPSADELAEQVAAISALPFEVRLDGSVLRTADCAAVDLNAIAKGYIVDAGVAAASAVPGVVEVLVNAGGDLRHFGPKRLRVGVEDPADPGGPPITVIELRQGAIATSSPVHRGFRIAGRWYGHVIDPRSGWPVADRPSTTITAPLAATADALATVVGVMEWTEALDVLAGVPGTAALRVHPDGRISRWGAL